MEIGFDLDFDPNVSAKPDLPENRFPALVDTGADVNCIDVDLAYALKLPIVHRQIVWGVHGQEECNGYIAQIHVSELEFTVYGPLVGVHLRAGGQPHFAILGRSFLRHLTMVYEGTTGMVTLSL